MSKPLSSLATSAVLFAALSSAAVASAQTTNGTQPPSSQSMQQSTPASGTSASTGATAEERRPATTTFFGDTGLWYVPTAEVLPSGKWSVSAYRRGTNYKQGYTNVGDFAGTFAYGFANHFEVFGSWLFDTRIDRDTKPLFIPSDAQIGGIVDRYPGVNKPWSGNNVGDLYAGIKWNFLSEADRRPIALAARGMVKLPTGKLENGVSTGKTDASFDLIASHEISRVIELAFVGGYEFRGNPDGYDLPTGAFRWGVGAASPTRFPLRVFGELNGNSLNSDTSTITTANILGADGTRPPSISQNENITRATFGVTYQMSNGFFFGGGLSRNFPSIERNLALASEGSFTDYTDWQFRIGYHPGVRKYVAPAPPPPAPPVMVQQAPPAPPAPHTLSVRATCDGCPVEVSKTATVTATVTDSINCAVTYAWSAPQGTFSTPTARVTPWTAPAQPQTVPVTVTVTCPQDGMTAKDTINIEVTKAVVKSYSFDDVYFDFDRSSLRQDALRVLDVAIDAMKADATLSLTIEGNTCNIGTADYNLALGERRAASVREYLASRGVSADRLKTVSYGEERPKFDNAREETRRLNRRAVLVVTLQRE